MRQQEKHLHEFGRFALDVGGRVISRDELIKQVWPDSFVEEANLSHHIHSLRKALGEDKNGSKYIETIPRRGYRFVASVNESPDSGDTIVVAERSKMRIVVEETQESEPLYSDRHPERLNEPNPRTEIEEVREPRKKLTFAILGAVVALIGLSLAAYTWMINKGQPEHGGQGIRSIAVLPFKPLISGQRDEYLEIGMADTLITKLSSLKQVVVRPTSAVRQYTDPQQDALTAGRNLQVASVLDGSIQRLGDRIRVSVRLISIKDGATLWADKFDERFTDIFAVQDSISEKVAGLLAVKLTGDDRARMAKRYTKNTEAYQLYLMGRYHWNKRTEDGFRKGIEYFNQAIKLDPSYALAYSGSADCYALLSNSSSLAPREGFPKAKAAAAQALEIDDALAEAHTSLAFVLYQFEYDFADAEREFKRAIELNPNYATAHHWYSDYLLTMGRADEALLEMQTAQQNDPLSLVINAELGEYFLNAGQKDKAIEQLQRTIEMDPNFIRTHQVLGIVYLKTGMHDQAIAEFQRVRQLDDNPRALMRLGHAYAVSGKRSEAQKILEELKAMSRKRYVSPLFIAAIFAALGDNEQAFSWIEKAYEQHENISSVNTDEDFSRLRSDPGFRDQLRRLGIKP
jgi:TolB-like protein/DNA-binding winged helix-turn-helix (wHTH) protein/Tfp pilus assembly protein PilF